MATTKKPVSKKTTRSAATPRATVKRKKTPAKQEMRSFRIVKDDVPFTTFRITKQTIYWVILVAFIIFAQLWIINLQVEVATLLDAQQAQLQDL